MIVDLAVLGAGATTGTALSLTPEHPLWTNRGWTSALDLVPGDLLLGADGAFVTVLSGTARTANEVVYNLEVEGVHTYFAGAVPVLAHNACGAGASKGVGVAGRGSTAALEKGTTVARNLREQLAIEQAMGSAAAGRKLPFPMTDPRWPASEGWVKMQQVIKPVGEPINVHYLFNEVSGAIDDFKIILPGR